MIEIQDKTFSLFQRAVAARRRRLFPEVEEFSRCKFFSGNDFNSNGKKQTRPESSPGSTLHVSGSVSFYRFRSHRSIRKNLRRTIRFDIKFRYIVPNILSKTSSNYIRDVRSLASATSIEIKFLMGR